MGYAPSVDASSCVACPAGSYCPNGVAIACPTGQSSPALSYMATQCQCTSDPLMQLVGGQCSCAGSSVSLGSSACGCPAGTSSQQLGSIINIPYTLSTPPGTSSSNAYIDPSLTSQVATYTAGNPWVVDLLTPTTVLGFAIGHYSYYYMTSWSFNYRNRTSASWISGGYMTGSDGVSKVNFWNFTTPITARYWNLRAEVSNNGQGGCNYAFVLGLNNGCAACPVGYYCPSNNTFASACPAHSSSVLGSSSISNCVCNNGYYTNDITQGCTICPAGAYCVGGQVQTCPDGYISSSAGSTACTLCPPGYYTGGTGASQCGACPGGQYCQNGVSSTCPVSSAPAAPSPSGYCNCTDLSYFFSGTVCRSTYAGYFLDFNGVLIQLPNKLGVVASGSYASLVTGPSCYSSSCVRALGSSTAYQIFKVPSLSFTISFWMSINQIGTFVNIFSIQPPAGSPYGFSIYTNGAGINQLTWNTGQANGNFWNNLLTLNTWNQITISWTPTACSVYLNGTNKVAFTYPSMFSQVASAIYPFWVNGYYDNLILLPFPLNTDAQALALFQQGIAGVSACTGSLQQPDSNGNCVCQPGYYNTSGTCAQCTQGYYCLNSAITVCGAGTMSLAGASACTACANPCTNTSIALATCGLTTCPAATPARIGNTSWYGLGRIEASTVGGLVVPPSVWDVQGESAIGLMLNSTADRPTSLVQSVFTVVSGHVYALRFKAVCTGLQCAAGLTATWLEPSTTLFTTTNVSQSWMDAATSYFTATSTSMTLRFTATMPNSALSATVWLSHIYLADLGQWTYSALGSLQLQSGLAVPHRFSAAYVEQYPRVVLSIASGAYIQHSATVFPVPQPYQLSVWAKGTVAAQYSLNGGTSWAAMTAKASIDASIQPSWSQLVWTASSNLTTTMLVRLTASSGVALISDPQLIINQTMANLPCVTCVANYWCGAAAANLCPLNTLSPSGAASMGECYCRPGYYGTPFTSCAICPVNYYCAGGTDAVVCPNGTYSAAGSSVCLPCPAGEYCALGHVGTCPAHSYSGVGAADITQCACVAGYFGIAPNCAQCDVGFYCTGGATETACTADAATPPGATNASQCTCVSGFYGIHNDPCTACPDNSWCFTGLQNACPSNTYSYPYSFTTTNCTCQLGYTGPDGGPCSACIAGTYKDHLGTDACTQCPSGTISLTTAATSSATCTGCGVGTYSGGGGSVTCQICNSGTYTSAISQTVCATCAAGTWSSNTASVCTTCAAGTWSADGSSICSTCAAGSWSADSASACTTCTPGTWAIADASTCTSCTAGNYASGSAASTCVTCGAGSFSADVASVCTACSPGAWSLSTASTCTSCTPGLYAPGSSASTCLNCASGSFSDQSTASVCALCSPGSWSHTTASVCTSCAAGTFANRSGVVDCSNCTAGSYSHTAASICTACTPGSWSPRTAPDCTLCVAGTFSTAVSAATVATCRQCAPGYFSVSAGLTVCQPCSPGTYSTTPALVSQSQCGTCPIGGICSGGASLAYCVAGTVGYGTGFSLQSQCSACTSGYYCPGGAVITTCPLGSYSLATDVPSSALCPKCPTNNYCTNTTTEIVCPVNTNSQAGSSDLASCVCNPGYRCEMVQVVHAEITLPINASQFAELQAAYIAAVAAAAGVDPSQVIIVSITDAPTGGARRSLDGATAPEQAIEIHASIYNSMHTGSPHRALRTLDLELESLGLPAPLRSIRISLHREVVRATRADVGNIAPKF